MRLMRTILVAMVAAVTMSAHGQNVQYTTTDGVTTPIVTRKVEPTYTPEALKARLQGDVVLSAVVRVDGKVEDVSVVQSLDETYGLDQKAMDALRAWTFKPGMKDGQPVAVKVQVMMTFRLRSSAAARPDFRVVVEA